MAQNVLVMVALLIAAATPLAHGQQTNAIIVRGQVCCTPSGNCSPGATGLSGVPVLLNCTGAIGAGTITVGQGVTGVNGNINITVPNLITDLLITVPAILGGSLPCRVVVNLPLNQTVCPVLNTATDVLTAVPIIVGSVLSSTLGLIVDSVITFFVRVSI